MLSTKSATGRTDTVSALDVLMEKVPSPYSAVGAEPLPEDPIPTQSQWIRWEQIERNGKEVGMGVHTHPYYIVKVKIPW